MRILRSACVCKYFTKVVYFSTNSKVAELPPYWKGLTLSSIWNPSVCFWLDQPPPQVWFWLMCPVRRPKSNPNISFIARTYKYGALYFIVVAVPNSLLLDRSPSFPSSCCTKCTFPCLSASGDLSLATEHKDVSGLKVSVYAISVSVPLEKYVDPKSL